MYYTYILKLSNGKYYIGYSSDLRKRIRKHTKGRVDKTKNLKPKLWYYSAFTLKRKAIEFEKYLKSSSGFTFRNRRLI